MHARNLKPEERLQIWRRREGLTQHQAAKKLRISPQQYFRWEKGLVKFELILPLGRLSTHEECYILRRRAGMRQVELAQKLGVCRWWLNQMERGTVPNDQLVEYWDNVKTKPQQ